MEHLDYTSELAILLLMAGWWAVLRFLRWKARTGWVPPWAAWCPPTPAEVYRAARRAARPAEEFPFAAFDRPGEEYPFAEFDRVAPRQSPGTQPAAVPVTVQGQSPGTQPAAVPVTVQGQSPVLQPMTPIQNPTVASAAPS